MEDSSLQGQLRTKEANRGDERDGSLDKLNNGGRLPTSEGKHQKAIDEWTIMGAGKTTGHQATGKRVASDLFERNATKNIDRPW